MSQEQAMPVLSAEKGTDLLLLCCLDGCGAAPPGAGPGRLQPASPAAAAVPGQCCSSKQAIRTPLHSHMTAETSALKVAAH